MVGSSLVEVFMYLCNTAIPAKLLKHDKWVGPVLVDNYQEVVFTQIYFRYYAELFFDVLLHCNRILITYQAIAPG